MVTKENVLVPKISKEIVPKLVPHERVCLIPYASEVSQMKISISPVFPLPTDDLELLSCLASDGNDNESFEELFQKLAVMKGRRI